MGDKRRILGIGAFFMMLILVLDGKTAVLGAGDGIDLCLKTVIPSLFPFFVLSNLITNLYIGTNISLLRPVGKLCSIPRGMECILIPSFLGGYPVGAQTIAKGWQQGSISKEEAERLLGFCNNAGPSFVFGMTSSLFPNAWTSWLLWGIQISSALAAARLIPAGGPYASTLRPKEITIAETLRSSLAAMASVCGWVVLFRVVISFLQRWILWWFPTPIQIAAAGLLELSNGCISLLEMEDIRLRFVMCSGFLSFGGFCVMMQIISVAKGLSLRYFMYGKCIQTVLAICLAAGISFRNPVFLIIPGVILGGSYIKQRKNSSIPAEAGV